MEHTKGTISLAKRLAHTDVKIRDKSIGLVLRYLQQTPDVSEFDVMKLFKGIFYCFWLSDKIPVQQELAEKFASLTANLEEMRALLYLQCFFKTMCREWGGLDRLRMDKFFSLVRKFVRAGLSLCQRKHWELDIVAGHSLMLSEACLVLNNIGTPVHRGVLLHVIDVFVTELEAVCAAGEVIPEDSLAMLLDPFVGIFAQCTENTVVTRLSERIFLGLFQLADAEERTRLGRRIVECAEPIAEMLFEIAANRETLNKTRNTCYEVRELFQSLDPLQDEPMEAVESGEAMETEEQKQEEVEQKQEPTRKKKKNKKNKSKTPELAPTPSPAEPEPLPEIKKKKKRKSSRTPELTPVAAPAEPEPLPLEKESKQRKRRKSKTPTPELSALSIPEETPVELSLETTVSTQKKRNKKKKTVAALAPVEEEPPAAIVEEVKTKKRKRRDTPAPVSRTKSITNAGEDGTEEGSPAEQKSKKKSKRTAMSILPSVVEEEAPPVTPKASAPATNAAERDFQTPRQKSAIPGVMNSTKRRVHFSLKANKTQEFDKEKKIHTPVPASVLLAKKSPGSALKSPAVRRFTF